MMNDWRVEVALGMLRQLVNDDVPYAVLGLCTNDSLGTEASTQEVDSPQPLLALNSVRAHARIEGPEDLQLPRLAHGFILVTLDCRAKVGEDREQDILDGDDRIPRGISGIRPDSE